LLLGQGQIVIGTVSNRTTAYTVTTNLEGNPSKIYDKMTNPQTNDDDRKKDIVRKNAGLPVTDEGVKQSKAMKKIVDVTKDQLETNEKYQKEMDSLRTSKTRLKIEEKKSQEKFESEREKLEQRNELLNKQQSTYQEKQDNLQKDIKKLEDKKKNHQKEYDQTEDKIESATREINKLKRENHKLKNEDKKGKDDKKEKGRNKRQDSDDESYTAEDFDTFQRELRIMQKKAMETHKDVQRMENKVTDKDK